MNLRRVFEPSQRTRRENAAKAAAAAEQARTAKKSAMSEACLSEQELQLVAKVAKGGIAGPEGLAGRPASRHHPP
jgi:hypothetical protein